MQCEALHMYPPPLLASCAPRFILTKKLATDRAGASAAGLGLPLVWIVKSMSRVSYRHEPRFLFPRSSTQRYNSSACMMQILRVAILVLFLLPLMAHVKGKSLQLVLNKTNETQAEVHTHCLLSFHQET